jgi:Leucine-rich repeat (LRR) protein
MLPDEINDIQSLKHLCLRSCNFSSLNPEIGKSNCLQVIELQSNPLLTIPGELGNIPTLKDINLDYCKLKTVPVGLGNSPSLEKISIRNNELDTLPDGFFNLSSLKMCYLDNNLLRSLPNTIGSLEQVEHLSFRSNSLRTLPEGIGYLTKLKSLDLTSNRLTTLPNSIINTGLPPAGPTSPNGMKGIILCENDNLVFSDEQCNWLKVDTYWVYNFIHCQSLAIDNKENYNRKYIITATFNKLTFTLPQDGKTKICLYSLNGRLLSTLFDSFKKAGKHTINWNSAKFGSGIYFFNLNSNGYSVTKIFTILK